MTTMSSIPTVGREPGAPRLAVIGGRLEDDNAAIYDEMHRLSGGRIVIFPTASSEPETVGPETVEVFRAHGFDATLAGVYGEQAAVAAHDEVVLDMVREYGSVYFTGGNQAFITQVLAPDGVETPLLRTIREVHTNGGLVAGSSAGAAMMSETMIEGGTSLEAATFGVVADPEQRGMLLGRGLGFFRWGIVDQHFIKRGRFGRLVVAMAESGTPLGFGVDENTALFVDGTLAYVVGEYGAFVLDFADVRIDRERRAVENITVTYLDDGDAFDLNRTEAIPNADKRPVTPRDIGYRAPARSLRNVFGAYTLYDLMARLVLGDPESYLTDRARAVDPRAGTATTVEFERVKRISRALIAERDKIQRMTAINFRAALSSRMLNAAQLAASRRSALARDYGIRPGPGSRLMLLGSSPLRAGSPLFDDILLDCRQPVGIIASASAEPRDEARAYRQAFARHGIEATDFDVTIDNIDRVGTDSEIVEKIASLKTIVISGGNQIRLVEALLHRGEVTPVLLAIVRAYAAGATIVAVGGAASALSGFMIAGGTTYEALRFGIASDLGRRGLVIQEGLGIFGGAIVDQNLSSARRLGRLIVACAEEGVRYGIGLCEDSGVIANHDNSMLTVVGANGVVLVEIDQVHVESQGDDFIAPGTMLSFALPGDLIDLNSGQISRNEPSETADAALKRLVNGILDECTSFDPEASHDPGTDSPISLRYLAMEGGAGILDIESIRDDVGRPH